MSPPSRPCSCPCRVATHSDRALARPSHLSRPLRLVSGGALAKPGLESDPARAASGAEARSFDSRNRSWGRLLCPPAVEVGPAIRCVRHSASHAAKAQGQAPDCFVVSGSRGCRLATVRRRLSRRCSCRDRPGRGSFCGNDHPGSSPGAPAGRDLLGFGALARSGFHSFRSTRRAMQHRRTPAGTAIRVSP